MQNDKKYPIDEEVKNKLNEIINFLKQTKDKDWYTEKCGSKEGRDPDDPTTWAWCLRGHVMMFGYKGLFDSEYTGDKGSNRCYNWFEATVATEYMFYGVNDGNNKKYQQKTPKARCIAYLLDIANGKKPTTSWLWDNVE